MDIKIINLEQKISHLELDNEQLNNALYKQQQQIDKLKNSIIYLNKQLEQLIENKANNYINNETPPPHY